MGKRKLPFGYQIASGEVVIYEEEAAVVREIFDRYVRDASYLEITEILKNQPVFYQPDKLWNKNMVARILENPRYIGESEFPPIVKKDMFQRAAEKRNQKRSLPQKTSAQKLLNRLCKGISPENAEPRVLASLNRLIELPQMVQAPESQSSENSQAAELHQQLDAVMAQQPADEDAANALIMQLAAERYRVISSEAYETERLRRYFERKTHMAELDADTLKETVSNLTIRSKKAIMILKNGQVIEME